MENNENNQVVPEVTAKITWVNTDASSNKRAAANITIDKCFTVHGLSIMNSNKGLFVAMPTKSKQDQNGTKFYEVAHPVTAEMRQLISDCVLDAYNKMTMNESREQGKDIHKSDGLSKESPKSSTETDSDNLTEESSKNDEDEEETEECVPIMGQI